MQRVGDSQVSSWQLPHFTSFGIVLVVLITCPWSTTFWLLAIAAEIKMAKMKKNRFIFKKVIFKRTNGITKQKLLLDSEERKVVCLNAATSTATLVRKFTDQVSFL